MGWCKKHWLNEEKEAPCTVCQLEGEVAVKDAALRATKAEIDADPYKCLLCYEPIDSHIENCPASLIDAVLSGTGEGWRKMRDKRDEAAERDAEGQRALVCYCCQDSCWPGCRCYDLVARDDAGNTVAPAEAQEELLVAKRNAESWQETAQQAQEERDETRQRLKERLNEVNVMNRLNEDVLRRERDAAIERGKGLYDHVGALIAWGQALNRGRKAAEANARAKGARFTVPIVCLCGSTRFMDAFNEAGWQKTLDGEVVLSVGVSKYLPDDHGGEWCGEDVAQALDELHKRKIDLADYVYVLNVGGYIGDSTRSEIDYAKSLGKRVDFLEPAQAQKEGD